MTIAEDAAIDDARLDVYCLRPQSFWRLMALFPALRRGRLERQQTALLRRGREVEVKTRRPMPINTDGELTTETPARFVVLPKAVTVLAPAEPSARTEELCAHAAQ